jgi:hypothetical protein
MPRKKLIRKKAQEETISPAIAWVLSDGLLGPEPAKNELYGFDFHPDFPWWGSIDPECNGANPELMRLLRRDYGAIVAKMIERGK